MQVQTESLGPAFEFTPEYSVFWSYVPHFIHSPFYVYAYAFGDCLVNALYSVFQAGHPGFQAKYLDMLRAGGTKRHKELLAPFGLDASDPAFWKKGLDVISGFIDELEQAAVEWRRSGSEDATRSRTRSNLFGELRRMARTSGAVGGIAARVAGARVFGIKTDRAAHAEDLKTILGGLKGPLMKVAQFLSTVPDALPAEYAAELAQLQANAPPMGWTFVRRRMASELGTDWQSKFAELRPRGRRRGQPGPGASRAAARRHRGRLQAAVPGHAEHGRGRPPAAEAGDGDLPPHGQCHPARGGLQGTDANACARSSTTSARRRRCGCTAHAGERPDGARAGADDGFCTRRLLTMTWLDGRR